MEIHYLHFDNVLVSIWWTETDSKWLSIIIIFFFCCWRRKQLCALETLRNINWVIQLSHAQCPSNSFTCRLHALHMFLDRILFRKIGAGYNGRLKWAIIPLLGKEWIQGENPVLTSGPQTRHWHWHLLCTWERCCANSLHFAYELIASSVVLQLKAEGYRSKKVTFFTVLFTAGSILRNEGLCSFEFMGMIPFLRSRHFWFRPTSPKSNPGQSQLDISFVCLWCGTHCCQFSIRKRWCDADDADYAHSARVIKTSLLFLIIHLNVCCIAALLFNGP